jgi:hypothetical protein
MELFNEYLNYPCGYATVTEDAHGKRHGEYETCLTPYERFLTLDKPEQYLRRSVTRRHWTKQSKRAAATSSREL